jgi:hypothetical protein
MQERRHIYGKRIRQERDEQAHPGNISPLVTLS